MASAPSALFTLVEIAGEDDIDAPDLSARRHRRRRLQRRRRIGVAG
jgi:hypothetical protein